MREFILKAAIVAALAVCAFIGASAQNITREGTTFKSISHKAKVDTIVTAYRFEDSKGNSYPIIVNKASGRCYIWKKSSKTGKMYKQYLKPEVAKEVCKELNILYK